MKPSHSWSEGEDKAALPTDDEGAFRSKKSPQITRVSAVLVTYVRPWNLSEAPVWLVHHPWARHPLPTEAILVRQTVFAESELSWTQGKALAEILGLA